MPSIAPLVAGHWPRRLGGLPGPFSAPAGSGESPSGAPIQVELFVDGLWTDITSYVMTRDGSYRVNISRGQPNESGRTEPSRCTMQLNNRDGRFSPRNPTSPYYGKLGRNQPLRFSVPSGNDKSYRFWGEVSEWPVGWDTTGNDVWVDLEAAGLLRRLGQGQSPIGSSLYVDLANGGTLNPVVAYWPCEDGSTATRIASAIDGVPDMVISGSPSLAAFTSFVCSQPLPTLGTTGVFTASIPAYTTPVATMVRFLLAIPSGGATSGQVLCYFTGTGSMKRWEIYYDSSGGGLVGLRGRDSTGAVVFDTTSGGFSLNGELAQISAELVQDGADVDCTLYTTIVGTSSAAATSGTATGRTVGVLNGLAVGGALAATAIGHIRVQTSSAAPTDVLVEDQLTAYAGEPAADRIFRLCRLAGISFHLVGDFRDAVAMGAQTSHTVLELIQECVAADGGLLFELLDRVGLGYRTRVNLENQSSALALSYPGGNLAEVPRPVDDDQRIRNDIMASRPGGSSARARLSEGAMSVLEPPAGVGRYDEAVTVNVEKDDDLADQAGWRLHLGTVDEARFPQIAVNLAHASFVADPALRLDALAVAPGDRVTVTGMPSWAPDDVSQLMLGVSETIDQFQHRLTFNCQPESPYRVAVADDTTYGRVDTDGSQLAADVSSTGTALSVATTSGPLWTTSAPEFPFDIRVGGEVMKVTNITGSSSPQTFTVTRSVNGVVKPQTAATDVRLDQPAIAAL
ncbi:hypothetical protein BX265_6197 [Streptomyces sp. TLI_235]|nr:hypothetical protein [Streptomyces sp. TLI_235]PBC71587.1 hypothetical protein BX265_6197 [Streptomyces sp. TLI_235]